MKTALILSISLVLTACGTSDSNLRQNSEVEKYLSLSENQNDENTAIELKIKAIEKLLDINKVAEAKSLLESLANHDFDENISFKHLHCLAQIAYSQRQYNQSLKLISKFQYSLLSNSEKISYHFLKSKCYRNLGNLEYSIKNLILVNKYLASEDINTNNKKIWQQVNQLSSAYISNYKTNLYGKNIYDGWIELANIMNVEQNKNPAIAIKKWLLKFPEHPAKSILPEHLVDTHQNYNIALLLPTQKYNRAASAVAAGIYSAHYAYNLNDTKITSFYYNDKSDFKKTIRNLQNEAYDVIIGPLTKPEVKVISEAKINAPVLALNTSENSYSKNLYHFALPPEQEAKKIAQKAWQDGHHRAIIISNKSKTSSRLSKGFAQEWQNLGGEILDISEFKNNENLEDSIKDLLGLNISNDRKMKLIKILNAKLQGHPRRRQDIDAIFIATTASEARLIKPLLNFHHAKNIYVYATSNINENLNQGYYKDLDGIIFCDMPWKIQNNKNIYKLKNDIARAWPSISHKSPRLIAFGIDAYVIAKQLIYLKNYPNLGLPGKTGFLFLKQNNIIHRDLLFAQFHAKGIRLLAG